MHQNMLIKKCTMSIEKYTKMFENSECILLESVLSNFAQIGTKNLFTAMHGNCMITTVERKTNESFSTECTNAFSVTGEDDGFEKSRVLC